MLKKGLQFTLYITYLSIFHLLVGIKFEKHQCKKLCMDDQKYTYDPEKFVSKEEKLKNFNPILIPVILGWKRQLTKHKNMGKRSIYYVSPCGRRLRNLVRFKMKRIFFERRNSIFSLGLVSCILQSTLLIWVQIRDLKLTKLKTQISVADIYVSNLVRFNNMNLLF